MPLKCWTRHRKDGSNYTNCVNLPYGRPEERGNGNRTATKAIKEKKKPHPSGASWAAVKSLKKKMKNRKGKKQVRARPYTDMFQLD